MIHIYTGNGKGKSTAAAGLAVRAAGAGMRVCFIQLLKNGTSSEIAMLKKLGIMVRCAESCNKFTFAMTDEERSELTEEHNSLLSDAERLLRSKTVDLLVLDEFMAAYNGELLDRDLAEMVVKAAAEAERELVLTGRNVPEKFVEMADYVTVMEAKKHPYEKGVTARKGIEY